MAIQTSKNPISTNLHPTFALFCLIFPQISYGSLKFSICNSMWPMAHLDLWSYRLAIGSNPRKVHHQYRKSEMPKLRLMCLTPQRIWRREEKWRGLLMKRKITVVRLCTYSYCLRVEQRGRSGRNKKKRGSQVFSRSKRKKARRSAGDLFPGGTFYLKPFEPANRCYLSCYPCLNLICCNYFSMGVVFDDKLRYWGLGKMFLINSLSITDFLSNQMSCYRVFSDLAKCIEQKPYLEPPTTEQLSCRKRDEQNDPEPTMVAETVSSGVGKYSLRLKLVVKTICSSALLKASIVDPFETLKDKEKEKMIIDKISHLNEPVEGKENMNYIRVTPISLEVSRDPIKVVKFQNTQTFGNVHVLNDICYGVYASSTACYLREYR